jgi:hypothetical protein
MEWDGAALMSCWGDDSEKGDEGWRLVKEAKEGKGAQQCMERLIEKSDFWKRALESKDCFLILDEHCSERGDPSIARGWGRTREEFLLLDFVLKMEG